MHNKHKLFFFSIKVFIEINNKEKWKVFDPNPLNSDANIYVYIQESTSQELYTLFP